MEEYYYNFKLDTLSNVTEEMFEIPQKCLSAKIYSYNGKYAYSLREFTRVLPCLNREICRC